MVQHRPLSCRARSLFIDHGPNKYDEYRLTLLCLHVAATLALLLSIYFSYSLWLWWKKTEGAYFVADDLINTGIWKQMVCEILLNVISPMPFLYKISYNDYYYPNDFRKFYAVQINTILLI